MKELVLDASVLVKWFRTIGELHLEAALGLYRLFSQGELLIHVPPLLFLEFLNAAARRWGWEQERLEQFAVDLQLLGLEVHEPALARLAHWCGRGLTAYDACNVALAEEQRTVVVTEDERILAVAGPLAQRLSSLSI